MVREHDVDALAPEQPVHARQRRRPHPVATLDLVRAHALGPQSWTERPAALERAHGHAQAPGDAGLRDRGGEHLRAAWRQRVHDLHHVRRHARTTSRDRTSSGAASTRGGASAARSTCSRSAAAVAMRK